MAHNFIRDTANNCKLNSKNILAPQRVIFKIEITGRIF